MRVLLTSRGSSGHVTRLAPFGHALVRAGHGVLVAAQHHFAANVERTGLAFGAVGAVREEDWMPLLPRLAQMRLDERHDEMCSEFFGRLEMASMLPGLREVAAHAGERADEDRGRPERKQAGGDLEVTGRASAHAA